MFTFNVGEYNTLCTLSLIILLLNEIHVIEGKTRLEEYICILTNTIHIANEENYMK